MIGLPMIFFEIILMIILSSCWGIVIVEEFIPLQQLKDKLGLGQQRKLYSQYIIIDYIIFIIWKVIGCPMCMSYHLFWISYLIIFGSFFGLILGVLPYFLTFFIKKWMSITL